MQRAMMSYPVEEFGQRIAADFIIVHKDSRNTETVVLVIRDEARENIPTCVKACKYPSGPCVLFKSDNARELLSAYAILGCSFEPSLERRWPHNSVLEREIRTIEECTRALRIASYFQLHSGLWDHTIRYAALTLNLF